MTRSLFEANEAQIPCWPLRENKTALNTYFIYQHILICTGADTYRTHDEKIYHKKFDIQRIALSNDGANHK